MTFPRFSMDFPSNFCWLNKAPTLPCQWLQVASVEPKWSDTADRWFYPAWAPRARRNCCEEPFLWGKDVGKPGGFSGDDFNLVDFRWFSEDFNWGFWQFENQENEFCVSWRCSPRERISCQMYCKRFASNRLLKDTSDVWYSCNSHAFPGSYGDISWSHAITKHQDMSPIPWPFFGGNMSWF